MKERPILFNGAMVRAILNGRKTMTRRTRGLERINENPQNWNLCVAAPHTNKWVFQNRIGLEILTVECPCGLIGDGLWVRETFGFPEQNKENGIVYRATDPTWDEASTKLEKMMFWRPSIHMPRCLSRITLEVTDVRVERLQDISEEDAVREGVENIAPNEWRDYRDVGSIICPCGSFRSLWETINGRESWDANQWVWVVEFRMVAS